MPIAITSFAFLGGIGGGEIILVLLVVLILFGGDKMPELARGLGKTLREFKKATSGVEEEIKRALAEPPPPKRTYTIKPVTPEIVELPPSQPSPPAHDTPPETPPHA